MAATVTLGVQAWGRQVAPINSVAFVYVTVAGAGASYATSLGGLPFDIFTAMSAVAPPEYNGPINAKDVLGFLPIGLSTLGWLPHTFAVGTATSTTMPCTIRLAATGAAASGSLGQVIDGTTTDSFSGFLMIQRGGAN